MALTEIILNKNIHSVYVETQYQDYSSMSYTFTIYTFEMDLCCQNMLVSMHMNGATWNHTLTRYIMVGVWLIKSFVGREGTR